MNIKIAIVLIVSQLTFTASDLLARPNMKKDGFVIANFLTTWFLIYFTIRIFATLGQLYVFSTIKVGKTMALFGATSIILANVLGFMLLSETLNTKEYIGITLAVLAFLVLAVS